MRWVFFSGFLALGLVSCNRDGTRFSQVKNDLFGLRNALSVYQMDTGRLPTTEQGLEALENRPTVAPVPEGWRRISDQVPLDPWGNPYQYRRLDQTAAENHSGYDLWSMGRDGVSGTADDVRLDPE